MVALVILITTEAHGLHVEVKMKGANHTYLEENLAEVLRTACRKKAGQYAKTKMNGTMIETRGVPGAN